MHSETYTDPDTGEFTCQTAYRCPFVAQLQEKLKHYNFQKAIIQHLEETVEELEAKVAKLWQTLKSMDARTESPVAPTSQPSPLKGI